MVEVRKRSTFPKIPGISDETLNELVQLPVLRALVTRSLKGSTLYRAMKVWKDVNILNDVQFTNLGAIRMNGPPNVDLQRDAILSEVLEVPARMRGKNLLQDDAVVFIAERTKALFGRSLSVDALRAFLTKLSLPLTDADIVARHTNPREGRLEASDTRTNTAYEETIVRFMNAFQTQRWTVRQERSLDTMLTDLLKMDIAGGTGTGTSTGVDLPDETVRLLSHSVSMQMLKDGVTLKYDEFDTRLRALLKALLGANAYTRVAVNLFDTASKRALARDHAKSLYAEYASLSLKWFGATEFSTSDLSSHVAWMAGKVGAGFVLLLLWLKYGGGGGSSTSSSRTSAANPNPNPKRRSAAAAAASRPRELPTTTHDNIKMMAARRGRGRR
jgi:hypothetical protein